MNTMTATELKNAAAVDALNPQQRKVLREKFQGRNIIQVVLNQSIDLMYVTVAHRNGDRWQHSFFIGPRGRIGSEKITRVS